MRRTPSSRYRHAAATTMTLGALALGALAAPVACDDASPPAEDTTTTTSADTTVTGDVAPTGLNWFFTCGDPVCSGHSEKPTLPTCGPGLAGATCTAKGAECDPIDDCNRRLVCSDVDPTLPPATCPRSLRALKDDIRAVTPDALDALYAEVRALPLATWRYKTPADERRHLGFVLDEVSPTSPAVDLGRGQVDVYGLASMAIAAVKVQAEQLDALRAELATLRQRLDAAAEPGLCTGP